MTKCNGCGIIMQDKDPNKAGYTPSINNSLCLRCFQITNYNKHEIASNTIQDDEIITKVNDYNFATLFLCDILNLNQNVISLYNKIKHPKMFVITKMDIIPKNIDLFKLEEKLKRVYDLDDLIFFSIKNGFGKKHILDYLNFYHNVVLVGPTSSGKSSLINYLFDSNLTVSNYKNTTQDFIKLSVEDINIIDAPGFNNELMIDSFKQSGFIKTKTLSIKKGYKLCIDKYEITFNENSNVCLYFPNNVILNTKKSTSNEGSNIKVNDYSDLIINNLGFIYFKNKASVTINDLDNVEVRESIVGGL